MTDYVEVPLREHGQGWPGLKTSTGPIARAPGEMGDCVNVMINSDDVLEKRKGMVRGLDERFIGPVCGLFTYTDQCGQEFVLVADSDSVKIRTPFRIPTFTVADCYPSDGFDLEDGSPIDEVNWRNQTGYQVVGFAAVLDSGAAPDDDSDGAAINSAMRWFKDACSSSYQILIEYDFSDPCLAKQKAIIVLRGAGDLTSGAAIFATLEFCTSPAIYRVKLKHRAASGQIRTINQQSGLTGQKTGFLRLAYEQQRRVASLAVTPVGGAALTLEGAALQEIEDLDLGLTSAIGLSFSGVGIPSTQFRVKNVSGGSFG